MAKNGSVDFNETHKICIEKSQVCVTNQLKQIHNIIHKRIYNHFSIFKLFSRHVVYMFTVLYFLALKLQNSTTDIKILFAIRTVT
jgi:hypothetical protein